MSEQAESKKSLETLLRETIRETRERGPMQNDKDYNRDQLREIAEQISRRYVTSIREGTEPV